MATLDVGNYTYGNNKMNTTCCSICHRNKKEHYLVCDDCWPMYKELWDTITLITYDTKKTQFLTIPEKGLSSTT